MKIDIRQFHAAFFEESSEHLATLEDGLIRLEGEPHNMELLNSIFRAAHSIKGSSGTFGFAEISGFTHGLESLLDRLRDGTRSVTPELVSLLLRGTDTLQSMLAASRNGEPAPAAAAEIDRLIRAALHESKSPEKGLNSGDNRSAAGSSNGRLAGSDDSFHRYSIKFRPGRELLLRGMDPLLVLRELSLLGRFESVECDQSQLPPLNALDPVLLYLSWSLVLNAKVDRKTIQEVFIFIEDECVIEIAEVAAVPEEKAPSNTIRESNTTTAVRDAGQATDSPTAHPQTGKRKTNESIRVSVDKIENLINLVGESVIAMTLR